ncbi:MAG: formimidoylglutamase [Planctomycetes bacterium]|nr:formimidoylglutamase [Planctomycetota bacterium]
MIPQTTPSPVQFADARGKLAAAIHTGSSAGCHVALLGLPDDLGVRLNNGRPGAAKGPDAFRTALSRYGVAAPHGWIWPSIFDAGNVLPSPGADAAALAATHARVSEAAAALVRAGMIPVAIGGGHDLTFAFIRGVLQGLGRSPDNAKASVLYFDAHLDVRDTPGSGMPFRALSQSCGVRKLHIHGYNPFVNSAEHVEWFTKHGGVFDSLTMGYEDQNPDEYPPGDLCVSFDLDCLDASIAPGVSATNPLGLSMLEVSAHVQRLGSLKRVKCFDLMELNPEFDDSGRTARLAAHLFLEFLRGVSDRLK